MKDFFKRKKKLLGVALMVLLLLTSCSVPRGKSGKTYVDSIITLRDETVQKQNVDFREGSPEAKKYKDLAPTDTITIEATSFSDAFSEGWFHGLIVYPIAQLINWSASFTDAGIGIIIGTFFIQLLIFLFSLKSQVANQRMQELQPQMQKIQAKYAGRTDDNARMQQAQEVQALYSKYKINPFGTILITFLQFPIILGMYQATMRAYSVITGSFIGINLAKSPIDGLKLGGTDALCYVLIFGLMILFQFLSFKIPQILSQRRKKAKGIKEKKYAQPKNEPGMMGSMNMMMYTNIAMISLFAINWPLAMSFYWLVSSVIRVLQNVVISKFFIKD